VDGLAVEFAVAGHRRHRPALAEGGGEVGVLAVGLLDAPPAGVAGEVEIRREDLADARRARLGADCLRDLADERVVEGRAERDRLREDGAAGVADAMERLARHQERDAEARLLAEEALDRVEAPGRREVGVGVRRPVAVAAGFARVLVDVEAPHEAHLRDFLADGHAPEQILDALVDRCCGILVEGVEIRHGPVSQIGEATAPAGRWQ
jgi:hypothetical protein